MFNFTTQTIYNEIVESGKGKNIWVSEGPKPALRIGNTRFDVDDIESVQVKAPSKESLASVTFDLAPLIEKVSDEDGPAEITGRIALYIGLSMNSQDSFYANDFVYKGKPFYVEFPVKKADTVDVLAKRVKKIADKFLLFQFEEKVLDVTADASAAVEADAGNNIEAADATGSIVFTGVNGYQQIKKAELQWYNPEATTVDCCTMDGDFEVLVTGVPVIYTIDSTTGLAKAGDTAQKLGEAGPEALAENEVAILPGLEAFGDYNWIIHNLRLPTAANTNFWSFTKQMKELPIPGQEYTQFIIRMAVKRDGIAGGVVGQRAVSVTNHVLYVIGKVADTTSAAYKVNDALETLLGANAATVMKTDADDVLAEPYASVTD